MSIISLISSKKGKIYFRLFLAAAFLAAAIYSYSALAANPSAVPRILTDANATTAQNATSAFSTNQKRTQEGDCT